MNLLEKNRALIHELCRKYHVENLYVFGSILTNKFEKESDVDLIVTFKPIELKTYADNYFDLKFSLEDLLNRKVDLLEEKALKNPFLIESIDSNKVLIYGQRDKSLAV